MINHKHLTIICLLLCILCLAGTVGAQVPDTITGMTLGIDELTMEIGESYQFTPDFETKVVSDVYARDLHIFSSDENVVKVTEELNTIEAVGGGEATLFIYTFEYEIATTCRVTVSGAEKALESKGDVWEQPSAKNLAKIKEPELKAFFNMLGKPEMVNAASAIAARSEFFTRVKVSSGKADTIVTWMLEKGAEVAVAHPSDNSIGVRATALQYRDFLENSAVLSVDPEKYYYVDGDLWLEGQSWALTMVDRAHNAGLDGSGTAVAILDMGFEVDNEAFGDRVILQACFSSGGSVRACKNGQTSDLTSAALGAGIEYPENVTHGDNVAAIAAGENGVAPQAGLVLINVASFRPYICSEDDDVCYNASISDTDVFRAFNFLRGKMNGNMITGTDGDTYKMAAVNLSFGDGIKHNSACGKADNPSDYEYYADWFRNYSYDVSFVIAAGNEGFNGGISAPACSPSAFAVGALWDSGTPEVAPYSNHSSLVKLVAPGSGIYQVHGRTGSGTSYAAPMVTGAMALLRGRYPAMTAVQTETLLREMSTKTASRTGASNKVPVLDFSSIGILDRYLSRDASIPAPINSYGGNKLVQLDFLPATLKTNYVFTIYNMNSSGNPVTTNPVKTTKGSNVKTLKISGLTNEQPYWIKITGEVTLGKTKYAMRDMWVNAMPMEEGKNYTFTFGNNSTYDQAVLYFDGTVKSGEVVAYWYDASNSAQNVWVEGDDYPEVPYNQVYTAELHRVLFANGYAFFSLPKRLTALPVDFPHATYGGMKNGKIWLELEPNPLYTQRIVTVYQRNSAKPIKKLTVDAKKNPKDVLITGLKDGTEYKIEVQNVIKSGNITSQTSGVSYWWLTPTAVTWDPTRPWNSEKEGYVHVNDFQGVSLTAGDQKAVLSYSSHPLYDGYRFEMKPIYPNMKKSVKDVAQTSAGNSYVFTGLTNGALYKMRFLAYYKLGSKLAKTWYYPGDVPNNSIDNDNSWDGLLLVPLAAPQVTYLGVDPDDMDYLKVTVKNDLSADGFVVITVGNDAEDFVAQEWNSESGYTTCSDIYVSPTAQTSFVMLYKDYLIQDQNYESRMQRFYGPAVLLNDITYQDGYADNYSSGSFILKSAEPVDLRSLPKLADAAQVDGQVVISDELFAKSLDFMDGAWAGSSSTGKNGITFEFEYQEFDEDDDLTGTAAKSAESESAEAGDPWQCVYEPAPESDLIKELKERAAGRTSTNDVDSRLLEFFANSHVDTGVETEPESVVQEMNKQNKMTEIKMFDGVVTPALEGKSIIPTPSPKINDDPGMTLYLLEY